MNRLFFWPVGSFCYSTICFFVVSRTVAAMRSMGIQNSLARLISIIGLKSIAKTV